MLDNREKHWSAHCSASLASSASCERATTSLLGREKPCRDHIDAMALKPISGPEDYRKVFVPTVQGIVVGPAP